MINFFVSIYDSVIDKKNLLAKLRYYSLLRFIIRRTANGILPLYFRMTSGNKKYSIKDLSYVKQPKLIVNLTSFPVRISKVWIAIESILRQTEKPDAIILWLSKEQFSSKDSLPKNLLRLEKRGIKISIEAGEDLRSHKKYFYALNQFPTSTLVTIDDDIIYNSHLLESLLKWHDKYPNAIIANYASKMKIIGNQIFPYKEWSSIYVQDGPDYYTFFGSGGGTLIPATSLHDEVLNKEVFKKICFYADDIWLNAMCRLNYTKVFRIHNKPKPMFPIVINNNKSLSKMNVNEDLNDIQIKNVRDYYIQNKNRDIFIL